MKAVRVETRRRRDTPGVRRHTRRAVLAALATCLLLGCTGAAGSAGGTRGGVAPSPAVAARSPAAAPAQPAAPERVVLAISARSLSFLPQIMARSLGFFEAEGLEVEIPIMRSDLQMAGMLSGELDYSATGGDPLLLAVAEGAQVKSILTAFDSTHFTLVGQKGMERGQLKGARIGVSRLASSSHLEGKAMVSYLGLDPDTDVTFFSTGETSTSFAALEARNIDAAVLSPPFSSELVSKGYAALARASDTKEKAPFTGLASSVDHLRAKPDQAVRMLRALLKSLDVMATDKPRTIDLLLSEWEIDPAWAEAVYDETTRPLRRDGRLSEAAVQQWLDRSLQSGLISRPLRVADLTDSSFLERARASR